MKEFLQEWGTAIITAVAVVALIAVVVSLRPIIKSEFSSVLQDFKNQKNIAMEMETETETPNTNETP